MMSIRTAITTMIPVRTYVTYVAFTFTWNFARTKLSPLLITTSIMLPITEPETDATPPAALVPPMYTPAIASSSYPLPVAAATVVNDADQKIAAIPAPIPPMMYASILYLSVLIPESLVASSLLPIERMYLPTLFLYIRYIQINMNPTIQIRPTGKDL